MRYKRLTLFTLSLMLLTGLLAGCSTGGNESKNNEKTTLKVMYYDERGFYSQYGMLFSAIYPNIEIEVISTQNVNYEDGKDMQKALKEFIEEQKPDVLALGTDEYSRMAGEGKLYNLESFIQKDEYDLEGIVPGVVDYLKEQSDGILYGLAPNFYSQAIYYNKDLFTKYDVPFPEDRMSWKSLLELAAQFPTTGTAEERVYGLKAGYNNGLYQFGQSIGASQGLSYVNPTNMQMTINTDSWKTVFETAQTAIESGTLYMDDPNRMMSEQITYESHLLRDPFIGGKVAMTMDASYLMEQIKEAKSNNTVNDKAIKNWDLVTMPVNPQNPDESSSMSIHQIFAIDAKSTNPEAAWKFISYINSDEFARVTSKVQNGSFPTRTKYLSAEEGLNMAAFYSLRPVQSSMYKDFDKLPQDFFMKFDGITQQEMQGVTDGQKSVSEALDNLQAQGQKILLAEMNKKGIEEKTDVKAE